MSKETYHDIEQQMLLRDQKIKLVQLVVNSKTRFERESYLADLREVCRAMGKPEPDEGLIGLPLPKSEKQ